MNRKLYEQNRLDTDGAACLLAPEVLDPGVTLLSAWLGMANYDKVMFVLQGGPANDAAATLDAQVYQATDNMGAGAMVIPGKAITQVVAGAGFATLNDLWLIHVDVSELDVDNFYAFVNLTITVSAADTWTISAVCLRESRVFEPAPVPSVTEIVD